jgi:ribokinase
LTVLVLGNAAIDITYDVDRLPVPGETLLAASKRIEVGGKGLNQAVTAHRAGAAVRFVAAVGHDVAAGLILERLATEGMAVDGICRVEAPTDESLVLVAAGTGENAIVSTVAAARSLPVGRALAAVDGLDSGDLMLLQGNLGRDLTEATLRHARARGARILLNPAPIAFDYAGLFELVDVAVLNAVEAASLAPVAAGAVIVTEGAAGARLLMGGREVLQVPAPRVAAVDTTGAGDVVCGVIAAALARGLDLAQALRWAVAAAASKVTRPGAFAGLPTASELARLHPSSGGAGPRPYRV